ncbi:hypothetical protein V7x_53430 [Crateriforma conspicua]|uniref:Uncharacterized protein n=1 Tax=Crateriforma conspicua TaxID=2527996 RepID=A0A5C6FH21_9PLAN|nr:hypothetical protein V7x_53430 [Crateriforma conspicua]
MLQAMFAVDPPHGRVLNVPDQSPRRFFIARTVVENLHGFWACGGNAVVPGTAVS